MQVSFALAKFVTVIQPIMGPNFVIWAKTQKGGRQFFAGIALGVKFSTIVLAIVMVIPGTGDGDGVK